MKYMTIHGRFLSKITKFEVDGCWIYGNVTSTDLYGTFYMNDTDTRANRAAYQLFVGPIPKGLFVCHHCDVKRCVNPAHLFIGTNSDNLRDLSSKGKHWQQRKLSCPKGHPYAGKNVIHKQRIKRGYLIKERHCRICSNNGNLQRHHKRKLIKTQNLASN